MVKKFNLSEAAAEILNASVSSAKAKQDKPAKLHGDVAYGTKEVGDIGTQVTKTTDVGPVATKGAPTATPPGATPPVGAEPMKKLGKQPAESGDAEEPEGKPGRQMMAKNKGATFETYGEEVEQFDEGTMTHITLGKKVNNSNGGYKQDVLHKGKKIGSIESYSHKTGLRYGGKHDASGDMEAGSRSPEEAIDFVRSSHADYLKSMKEEAENEDAELVSEAEKEEGHEDEKEDRAMIKKMMSKKNMKEDIDALLQGQNLSEEFVSKATTIFEAAVMSRVEEIAEELQTELEGQFVSALEEMKEDFATKIDDYLNYVVEQWMEENELAIESGLRSEIVEDFIGGLRNLFAEHYIDIPEEKVDIVQEMADRVEELEGQLNEQIEMNIEFTKEINEAKKAQAVQAVCEGLTQTQVEKLKSLAESIEFTTEEEFSEKLNTLKEAYVPKTVKAAEKSVLEEGVEIEEKQTGKVSHDPLINAVVNSISKSVAK